jgi:hypothetical protein
MDYPPLTKERLKQLLTSQKNPAPDIKVFSVHWGPNYAWQPATEIRSMAHFLVDECGVDIIHGHSSHHVQGVETYKGNLSFMVVEISWMIMPFHVAIGINLAQCGGLLFVKMTVMGRRSYL